MFTNFINSLAILVSLSTASGILVHDTHIDKAAMTVLSLPSMLDHYDTAGKLSGLADAHTHVERSSFARTANAFASNTPSIQPRSDDKKHMMQKHVARGHHAFDSYNLPIV
jgi:hypothetical protein